MKTLSEQTALELNLELLRRNEEYHLKGESLITDGDYDLKIRQLESWASLPGNKLPPGNILGIVGSVVANGLKHDVPMLSLDNALNTQELEAWLKTLPPDTEVSLEYKYDGMAASIDYVDGKIVRALTRGDGSVGEDLTSIIHGIEGVPLDLALKGSNVVRGEIVMPREAMVNNNIQRTADGDKPYSNTRNACCGTVMTRDLEIVKSRGLIFLPYDIITEEPITHEQRAVLIREIGGKNIPESVTHSGVEQVVDTCLTMEELRDKLPYDVDGVVVKVTSNHLRTELGFRRRSPRWAIAFKFKPREAMSTLLDVSWQVGRTGAITPVAKIEPVEIDGVNITSVTLHGLPDMLRSGIRLNDSIVVTRAGDVIPKITKVLATANSTPIPIPDGCPCCNSPVIMINEVPHCINDSCVDRATRSLLHVTSRKVMHVNGLGPKTAQLIVEGKSLKYYEAYNFWDLSAGDLEACGVTGKLQDSLLQGIERSKQCTVPQFLRLWLIDGLGESVSEKLMNTYGTVNQILENHEDWVSIDDIGPAVGETAMAQIKERGIADEIKRMQDVFAVTVVKNTSQLAGQRFVITGSFENYKRPDIKKQLKVMGADVSNSVSVKTTALIAGDKAGKKLKEATALNIPVYDEDKLKELLDTNNHPVLLQ